MPRVAVTVPDSTPQPYRFELDRRKVTIGRSSTNDIVIDSPSVSGMHCTMERVEGGYLLRDQDSTNGLKLENEKMAVIDLRNGIEVQVGDARLAYSLSEEELDELDEEEFVPQAQKADKKEKSDEKDREDPLEARAAKEGKRRTLSPAPARPTPVPLPSASSGGGGWFALATFICGFLAFYAGLDHSYTGKQKAGGREGEISLLPDIRDGRPPLPDKEKDDQP
jgi:pSer/pThr/pTyr-binding forkhead associated (FHA) protein